MDSLIRNPFGSPALIRKAYGEALVELGANRDDVVVLSADVQSSDFSYMFEDSDCEYICISFRHARTGNGANAPLLRWRKC